MHPAPSLIIFTTLSGLGFGLLAWLGAGALVPTGWVGFVFYALGYGLAGAGLVTSAAHLGHPERALKAFTQWRTSWLSREAVLSVGALLLMAPHAAGSVFFATPLPVFGWLGAVFCVATVFATSMIYAQIRAVPRWHHWTTPALFLAFALSGGALLSGQITAAALLLALLAVVMVLHWHFGDRRLAEAGSTPETATGLGFMGRVRLFEPPHTGANYLLREMVHVVGRKHAVKLRVIALLGAAVLPALVLAALPASHLAAGLAIALHGVGLMASRWLFFAEAEHVVGLYYGRR
ncbi:dibenzothiophene desulfurase [Rhodobacteraceae bacterium WD3A24]|nr:dibenzothiophene desulfurase [Rhodobacteraceae bacterium WD3A24]